MITLRNLSLQRGTKPLLSNVDITLFRGQKVGIVGANGCGKSSLFALLLGELHADQGDIDFPPTVSIAHVAQETPALDMSAIDYVLEGDAELKTIEQALVIAQQNHDGMHEAELHARFDAIGGYTARARAAQLLSGLGFATSDEEKSVRAFSGGWRMRLNLAQALMCRSDLLLLDEPTNHLDLDAVLWFEQWLKRYEGTLLLISHDRDFLDNVVNTIAHFYQQQITLYTGNYESFERQRAAKLALQQAAYQKQQREISHIHSFVERFRYKASKAKQAQSRLKALERMEVIGAAHVDSPFHFEFLPPPQMPHTLINLDKISIGYGEQPILNQVTLRISPGSRIGLLGPNGAGKSTFIKLLAGELSVLTGETMTGDGLRIGYFAQHQLEQLRPQESSLQHIQRLDPLVSEQVIRNFLGGFGFLGDMAVAAIEPFSGGEKARLALALLVWQKPNLLLLDEPTNHLDLDMRDALTMALQDYTGALVIVSHDRHLIRSTTDDLILVAQGQVKPFEGDLDDYRQWLLDHRANERSQQRDVKSPSENAQQRAEKKRLEAQQREQRRPLQNKLKQIEKQLDKLTTEKTTVETLLADPAIYGDKQKVQDYIRQQATLITQLQQVEEEWLTITETLDSLDN
ncbi:ATP-binding cassette domain-containing protein [Beggiatoa leptomitoformis]|uniref:Probable ATP-binding protein YheS n=1 Tax=Beggiatoa leptomitoformis TaxID=288004 RepID=A0A2N9YJ70_9GAMM|nr:ATP-binding cassette domain-containing protein [Beggiatoa leptomitoformis]ALG67386.1 ATP-binding cassette domain-containing protein [Beggiatoa leptomitoformis]AUI70405.1 ATP-binding cassette domain-containing protein [Beggiatoa leptomitoformis]